MKRETIWTFTLECNGECGSKIEIATPHKADYTVIAAEALRWTTVDKGIKQEVYCLDCVAKMQRVMRQLGYTDRKMGTA